MSSENMSHNLSLKIQIRGSVKIFNKLLKILSLDSEGPLQKIKIPSLDSEVPLRKFLKNAEYRVSCGASKTPCDMLEILG